MSGTVWLCRHLVYISLFNDRRIQYPNRVTADPVLDTCRNFFMSLHFTWRTHPFRDIKMCSKVSRKHIDCGLLCEVFSLRQLFLIIKGRFKMHFVICIDKCQILKSYEGRIKCYKWSHISVLKFVPINSFSIWLNFIYIRTGSVLIAVNLLQRETFEQNQRRMKLVFDENCLFLLVSLSTCIQS